MHCFTTETSGLYYLRSAAAAMASRAISNSAQTVPPDASRQTRLGPICLVDTEFDSRS
jgi:hypothetical protein